MQMWLQFVQVINVLNFAAKLDTEKVKAEKSLKTLQSHQNATKISRNDEWHTNSINVFGRNKLNLPSNSVLLPTTAGRERQKARQMPI